MIIIIIFKDKKCNILGKCDFFQQYQYSSYNYKIPRGASSFNTISAKVSTSLIVVFFTLFLVLLNSIVIRIIYSLIALAGGGGKMTYLCFVLLIDQRALYILNFGCIKAFCSPNKAIFVVYYPFDPF